MKRQPFRKVNHIVLAFLCCGCLFLSSCGLEKFYVLERPRLVHELKSDDDSVLAGENYVSFTTRDEENARQTSLGIEGTAVFYRIYGSKNVMNEQVNDIEQANTEYTERGYEKLTKSYGFQEMRSVKFITPVVPLRINPTDTVHDKTVTIRLTDEAEFEAEIYFVDAGTNTMVTCKQPGRYNDHAFNFQTDRPSPVNDFDTDSSVTDETTVWYVPVFATVSAIDVNWTSLHSQLLYLGYFTIRQGN